MRTLLIHAAHHCLAYYGVTKTYQDLSKDTFRPGQWEETKKFVESCDICKRIKQITQRSAGTARMIQVSERPIESICIDIIGPFPPSQSYEYALVVVYRFSSFIRMVPHRNKFNTRDIVEALISKIYHYRGMSKEIISDRGPQFVSNYFTELHHLFSVHLSPSTAFHQQTNGSAERSIKTIAQVLQAYVNSKQTNWVSQLWRAAYAYNNSVTDTYKVTPIEVCQGPVTNLYQYHQSKSDTVNSYLKMLGLGQDIFCEYLVTARYKQIEHASMRRNENVTFKVGDLVIY